MRTIKALAVSSFFLLLAVPAFAQDQGGADSSLLAMTVQVQRVYPHRLGYKVIYSRSDLYPGVVYMPGRWFTEAAGKAEIIYTSHPSAPYLTVFYRNGEVSHLRLVVQSSRTHRTWGALPSSQDPRDAFESDEFRIVY
ncbi:hypothetical protein SAMN05920897_1027 [Alkalispirochaeta americana]|uniref:Uncharacterized protein n=1 Tax=Alkalispirochaeta americana TaxID=159291 RepID=A0A1N6NX12_9SPIO|nr:hypothetical protein [Alkalispirochaeta americana]SIP96502.1 hypothetical protein SAMN05920897_1027 [Alkalispirochaeta americana]